MLWVARPKHKNFGQKRLASSVGVSSTALLRCWLSATKRSRDLRRKIQESPFKKQLLWMFYPAQIALNIMLALHER